MKYEELPRRRGMLILSSLLASLEFLERVGLWIEHFNRQVLSRSCSKVKPSFRNSMK